MFTAAGEWLAGRHLFSEKKNAKIRVHSEKRKRACSSGYLRCSSLYNCCSVSFIFPLFSSIFLKKSQDGGGIYNLQILVLSYLLCEGGKFILCTSVSSSEKRDDNCTYPLSCYFFFQTSLLKYNCLTIVC